jgi:hypothetical protein
MVTLLSKINGQNVGDEWGSTDFKPSRRCFIPTRSYSEQAWIDVAEYFIIEWMWAIEASEPILIQLVRHNDMVHPERELEAYKTFRDHDDSDEMAEWKERGTQVIMFPCDV